MNIGDHLVSPRTGYTHHGVYIGNNQVIHYSGFANGRNSGQIATASLSEFSNGCEIRVRKHPSRKYDGNACVERAFSRIGEDWYNVLMNNCEHFVNWCIEGSHRSEQVNDAILAASLTYAARQATATTIATTAASTVAKSVLSPTLSAGLSALANAAASTATTTAVGSGTASMIMTVGSIGLSTVAAPAIATAAVYGAVGYVAVSVFNWLWDD